MSARHFYFLSALWLGISFSGLHTQAQHHQNNKAQHGNLFEDIAPLLPAPNVYRGANGAPGPKYWQQRADYVIDCQLDEKSKLLYGEETITYTNHSEDTLTFLWMELSENQHHPTNHFDADTANTQTPRYLDNKNALTIWDDPSVQFQGMGMEVISVTDEKKSPLPYIINHTLMRVDLPTPLKPGHKVKFNVKWSYGIPNRNKFAHCRGGYEPFPDGNAIFTIAQWYPRMCMYNDHHGWDLLQFTSRAEFALTFGDFEVRMKVPADHIVAATGQCQNYKDVLSPTQYQRWKTAQNSSEPVFVVDLQEAKKNAKNTHSPAFRVWHYKAQNVRDFAWTSSRRFIWDAMAQNIQGRSVMCMSLYPPEAYSLYSKFSSKVVAHTLRTYSHYTVPYPYPVAISVEANNGMEYPMICFNHGRSKEGEVYSQKVKDAMISVIMHEIGHNFFPMIINSNERRWAWMDEGFNTFLQFLTEQAFDHNFASRRGTPQSITRYMAQNRKSLEPIMTAPDNIRQIANNIYAKTSAALNILRETILGRQLFDSAFKEYARRWAFKSPTPADFFRTMQNASGTDLSWFFRAWFFETTPVDISLDSVIVFRAVTQKQDSLFRATKRRQQLTNHITRTKNLEENMRSLVETDTTLRDIYTDLNRNIPAHTPVSLLQPPVDSAGRHLYELIFSNRGGSVMPIIIGWAYEDGTYEKQILPAEIWRYNEKRIRKLFVKYKAVKSIQLDPDEQTADINVSNNHMTRSNIQVRTLIKRY